MKIPFVYADFNSLESASIGSYDSRIDLVGYGSLMSLSRQKIQLSEGMRLIVYEPNDIEAEGVAHFDWTESDPAGRDGKWYALINKDEINESSQEDLSDESHLCFGCGGDLNELLTTKARNYTEECPVCRTSVMKPLEPPKDAI